MNDNVKVLIDACKKLLMHKAEGDLHPIDFQRIKLAIEAIENEKKGG